MVFWNVLTPTVRRTGNLDITNIESNPKISEPLQELCQCCYNIKLYP